MTITQLNFIVCFHLKVKHFPDSVISNMGEKKEERKKTKPNGNNKTKWKCSTQNSLALNIEHCRRLWISSILWCVWMVLYTNASSIILFNSSKTFSMTNSINVNRAQMETFSILPMQKLFRHSETFLLTENPTEHQRLYEKDEVSNWHIFKQTHNRI